jgi:hypothetical protein
MESRVVSRLALLLVALGLSVGGCERATPTAPWPPDTDPLVFGDTFGNRVGFQAFLGSKLDAVAIDTTEKYVGTASLKVTVPAPGSTTGGYAGGAFVAAIPRDLSGYNALSLWVKASRAVNLEVAGFGNDNTGRSHYESKRANAPVTTGWTQLVIPIPLPAKMTVERGLFFFAEGPQAGAGLTLWFDDVRFVNLSTVSNPRPAITTLTSNAMAGTSVSLANLTRTVFAVGGVDQTTQHQPEYFTFTSSAPAVASVSGGAIQVHSAGSAVITAKLGAIDATGAITVNATAPPATPAPTPPARAASEVISLFSGAYSNVTVDTWSATWDVADVSDLSIAGDPVKVYTNLTYAGIEFTTHLIDASAMTTLHLDAWATAGTTFRVKLVDFGANGIYGTDDSETELTFNAASTPAFTAGQWVSLDIPLASFTTLASRAHLAQLVISGDTRTVFVDNVYFHQ